MPVYEASSCCMKGILPSSQAVRLTWYLLVGLTLLVDMTAATASSCEAPSVDVSMAETVSYSLLQKRTKQSASQVDADVKAAYVPLNGHMNATSQLEKPEPEYVMLTFGGLLRAVSSFGGQLSTWNQDRHNVTISQFPSNYFDPANDAYPGIGYPVELHLPALTLAQLHGEQFSSLAEFLLELRVALCGSAQIGAERLQVQGIHERFQQPAAGLETADTHSVVTSREVLVRLAIMPAGSAPDAPEVVDRLRMAINDLESQLMRSNVSAAMHNATVQLSLTRGLKSAVVGQQPVMPLSAMALPIGISALFTGILIWLAVF